ncbi:hypothetical protein C5748_18265 [Phyllobacterium phragmitis]|uniref:Uncharacterized protein n=1 Tax=Phyllobacterium phragmitis TaxID=2670329 RepID=A0A2S9INJ5_9HYPH|nr:hypothetical protein [Phyllobacterium phragmitis]PRD42100.1 hypothetical protein C5748_18265 [Phyllobacterium phragmitis]
MTPRQQAKSITQSLENPLDRALVGFMNQHKGKWIDRDRIMHCAGFDDPKKYKHGAYVQFHCSLIRANRALAPHGLKICMSEDGANLYSMGRAEECR